MGPVCWQTLCRRRKRADGPAQYTRREIVNALFYVVRTGGKLIDWVQDNLGWTPEFVKRGEDATGFEVLPRRWGIERTFGLLDRYRRLRKDYEAITETTEALIYVAMSHLMVRRLGGQLAFSSLA